MTDWPMEEEKSEIFLSKNIEGKTSMSILKGRKK